MSSRIILATFGKVSNIEYQNFGKVTNKKNKFFSNILLKNICAEISNPMYLTLTQGGTAQKKKNENETGKALQLSIVNCES
jgi:hypothetical protein